MKIRLVLATLGLLACGLGGAAIADDVDLEGVVCPVSGRAASLEHSMEYCEATIYFCCPNCEARFIENTDDFAAKANHQLVQTGQAHQVKCPLSGREYKAEHTADVGGMSINMCCSGCVRRTNDLDDDGAFALVFGEGFEKGFVIGDE